MFYFLGEALISGIAQDERCSTVILDLTQQNLQHQREIRKGPTLKH